MPILITCQYFFIVEPVVHSVAPNRRVEKNNGALKVGGGGPYRFFRHPLLILILILISLIRDYDYD